MMNPYIFTKLMKNFEEVNIKHIPHKENAWANMLLKLASGKEKGQLSSIIRQVLTKLNIECLSALVVERED